MPKSYLNLDVTYQFAVEQLQKKEPREAARNAGAEYNPETGGILITYLGDTFRVSYPDGRVEPAEDGKEVSLTVKILILHYLNTANGAPLQGKLISFKELPDGAIYIEPFTRRAIKPMLNLFAERQDEFVELAKGIGAEKQSLGDTSVTIYPFPNVPITYVIWSGDDEFPASGNILFDASAPFYLPTEDYALVSGLIIYQLGSLLQKK
ncbi:DUF3786 domain-containing protein [Phosphitispora fastidiosa]|uniref:DUF3786 domain-containing protein n=1 Tax=Phosphitispora fastidiosa TaxID=2837202 RepID=UPI001E30E14C|nr:DUF3786 domain-containing protein [Phosphitispora fastidiosa]MBU7005132.1 hypothetical protein [Phosphitispora fastidiosa]